MIAYLTAEKARLANPTDDAIPRPPELSLSPLPKPVTGDIRIDRGVAELYRRLATGQEVDVSDPTVGFGKILAELKSSNSAIHAALMEQIRVQKNLLDASLNQ
jgi:hypothetical protein